MAYNIVILLMLKYGSAALLYVASAVILPLANISFTLKFIMASGATELRFAPSLLFFLSSQHSTMQYHLEYWTT